MSNWLLPESLADILPAEARRIEELRRKLLDLYRTYGFELVMPPLVEYLESLQAVSGTKLNLRTNKLVDQLSGRTMGVRADMTPQVARVDAHLLNREGVTRLCYCGPVLHARPTGLMADRELLQIGAEVFGCAGVEADIEIIRLALASVAAAGVQGASLDLNFPGIGQALINQDPALVPYSADIFDLLSTKDMPGIQALGAQVEGSNPAVIEHLLVLTSLYGEVHATLAAARQKLPALPEITSALDGLEVLVAALPGQALAMDLADMAGSYGYHTGAVFSVYAPGWHDALVRGGRYDGVGKVYGRSRPATGFSLDLRKLSGGLQPATATQAIRAPWGLDESLLAAISALRESGQIVIQMFPDQPQTQDEFIFDRELVLESDQWQLRAISA